MKPLFTQEEFEKSRCTDKLPCECYQCASTFYVTRKRIKDSFNPNRNDKIMFCSLICNGENKQNRKEITCTQCNKKVIKRISFTNKSKYGNTFCSQSCATTYQNTHKTSGYTRSKLEIWLEKILKTEFPNIRFIFNYREKECSELDIYLPELKIAIELNGIFHYSPVFGKEYFERRQKIDKEKVQFCISNNIGLLVIDISSQKNFTEKSSQKFLNEIIEFINLRRAQ